MTTASNRAGDEAEIRHLIDTWVEAFRSRDVDKAMGIHTPNIVSFDIVPPLRYVGKEAYRKPWDEVFANFEGPIVFEIRDLNITIREDLAYSHSINRMQGTMKNGKKSDYWFRWTTCYQKIDGKWLIVHDHSSVPTDFVHGKAVLDLQP